MVPIKLSLLFLFAALGIAACATASAQRYVITGNKSYEASLFRQNCAICHGPEAEGKTLADGRVVPNLREGDFKYRTDDAIYRHIADGGNGMVPFRNFLTAREINMLVRLVQDELRKSGTAAR